MFRWTKYLPWRYRTKIQRSYFTRRWVDITQAPQVIGEYPDLDIKGKCVMGNGCTFRSFRLRQRISVWKDAELTIGDQCFINDAVTICATLKISIGKHVKLGDQTHIYDSDFHEVSPDRPVAQGPIVIEDNVWIGAKALILAGSTIGKNSVIAAGSIVRGQIPDNCVAGGAPATVLKYFDVPEGWIRK